ncbi:DUF4350 domain-containing protein [Lysobacter terrestris]|uniref:DUF4350 domain-containing protein n=1 Tax=Agrilutibacter terrestris TaxID=2865112 RepID=A0A7H0G1I5_9GAMM|nr:DUF4350 domain-containing protein [Lysobacter terrestris]
MRTVLLTLLGVVLLAGLTAWWLHTHERVPREVDMPRIGEARRNPLFALQVALERDGVRVHSRRRLQLLADGARGETVPLAARDTVVLYNDPRTLRSDEVDALLRWVDGGGHLIVRTPPHGLLAKNAPVPLFAELQLLPMGSDRESGCAEVGGLGAPVAEGTATVGDDRSDEGGNDEGRGVLFCGARRFTLVGANPQHSWGDLQHGYVFARIHRGAGSVDVLAELDFLGSDALDRNASFPLAHRVLEPNYRAGTVHLVYAAQMPSLWATLARHSWMAWGPLLLALLAWLWRRMQRFGPQLATPVLERRSLLEHITASGELAYRYGYAHLLYDAARNAFLARLRRRDPQAAALQGEPQLMLLAARFTDVPAAEIRDALLPPFANDHTAFRTRIATLIRLRNRL